MASYSERNFSELYFDLSKMLKGRREEGRRQGGEEKKVNHRIKETRRDLWRSSGTVPWLKQDYNKS